MECKASVIIPAFNAEGHIGKCLEALKDQSVRPLEIILIDDGSTDRTAEMAKNYGVHVISQPNKGPAKARNMGAEKAHGDIVIFIDSDCVADKEWLKAMLEPFGNEGIAGVQGRYKTKQKSIVARFSQLEIEDRYDRLRKSKFIDFIGTYSAAYRKDIFLKFGGFDEKFSIASGEDTELSFRMAEAGHKMIFNEKAVVYHTHPERLSKYLRQKFYRAYWRVYLYRKHMKKAATESYTPQSLKLQILFFYLFVLSIIITPLYNLLFWGLLSLVLMFITTLPYSIKTASRDIKVGFLSPFMVILRTIVFSFGLIAGFASFRKKQL